MISMPARKDRWNRSREQGGIVILVALMLLTLLSVTAFSLSRTVIREIGISGNVYQAGRADAAADAGLDWFIVWEAETRKKNPIPAAAAKAVTITDYVNKVTYNGDGPDKSDQSARFQLVANVATKDGMVLQGSNPDGSMTQAFDLQMVFLGHEPLPQGAGGNTTSGNPGGSKDSGGDGRKTNLPAWEITSTGQALLPDDAWRYRSVRAAKITLPPPQ